MSLPNFVLDNSHEFTWPVKVPVPIEGRHKTFQFKARFKHVTPERRLEILEDFQEEAKARNQRLLADEAENAADDAETEIEKEHPTFEQDLLSEVLIGFEGINDTSGEPVEFSEASRDALLQNDFARTALLKAYMAALNGRVSEKNSSRRRGRGPSG